MTLPISNASSQGRSNRGSPPKVSSKDTPSLSSLSCVGGRAATAANDQARPAGSALAGSPKPGPRRPLTFHSANIGQTATTPTGHRSCKHAHPPRPAQRERLHQSASRCTMDRDASRQKSSADQHRHRAPGQHAHCRTTSKSRVNRHLLPTAANTWRDAWEYDRTSRGAIIKSDQTSGRDGAALEFARAHPDANETLVPARGLAPCWELAAGKLWPNCTLPRSLATCLTEQLAS